MQIPGEKGASQRVMGSNPGTGKGFFLTKSCLKDLSLNIICILIFHFMLVHHMSVKIVPFV